MKKQVWITVVFFLTVALLAALSELTERSGEFCDFDGSAITPNNKVIIIDGEQNESRFASLCNARNWLNNYPDIEQTIKEGHGGSITVVDEVTGSSIDTTLAYWVESKSFSVRENDCRMHVFKNPGDAAGHMQSFEGHEKPGYLAGLGKKLQWAKEITLKDVAGVTTRLSSFRGKVVFLRFWNSSNPYSDKDLQYLAKAYDQLADRGFVVLAVNVQESENVAKKIINQLDLPFPVLLDPQGKVADLYGIMGYPTGFIVDKVGIIRNQSIGEITPEMMEPLVYPLL